VSQKAVDDEPLRDLYPRPYRQESARRSRGGLYHVITRGNNRRQIFNSAADYEKFLSLLAVQKAKLSFFLYAY
jgi:REP element-mobilizing transposase RayT